MAKDQKRNIVYVSNRYDEENFSVARCEFEVEDVRWILGEPPVGIRDVDTLIDHGKMILGWILRYGMAHVHWKHLFG